MTKLCVSLGFGAAVIIATPTTAGANDTGGESACPQELEGCLALKTRFALPLTPTVLMTISFSLTGGPLGRSCHGRIHHDERMDGGSNELPPVGGELGSRGIPLSGPTTFTVTGGDT